MLNKLREIVGYLSPKLNTYISYLILKGRIPNLNNPKTFDEKISWLKLYDYPNNTLISQCADKLAVRDYVSKKGYGKALNELLGVWDSPEDICFDNLPNSFVLKWNHDYNSTVIVKDKDDMNKEAVISFLTKKRREKFYYRGAELHYKNIEPKVIAEKFLTEPGRSSLTDYKIYCYHGEPHYIMVCLERDTNPKFYFMDLDWELMRINEDGRHASQDFCLEKPEGIEKALEMATTLSKPFSFVRVDFYVIEKDVIFGEMTFTPSAGIDPSLDYELDLFLGEPLKLEDENYG